MQNLFGPQRGANAATKPPAVGLALALAFAATACSSPASEDVLTVKTARSLVAEWALVNREAARGRVTKHYADKMRENARSQLTDLRKSAENPAAPGVAEIDRAILLPANADAQMLDTIVGRLSHIETQLEHR
jgi:hypothetical protein